MTTSPAVYESRTRTGAGTCGKYPGECKDEVCTLPGYMTVDAETYAACGTRKYVMYVTLALDSITCNV